MIGWRDVGIIAVGVQSHFNYAYLNYGYNMEDLWTNWHKHCFTWKASGSFKVCKLSGNGLFLKHYQRCKTLSFNFIVIGWWAVDNFHYLKAEMKMRVRVSSTSYNITSKFTFVIIYSIYIHVNQPRYKKFQQRSCSSFKALKRTNLKK